MICTVNINWYKKMYEKEYFEKIEEIRKEIDKVCSENDIEAAKKLFVLIKKPLPEYLTVYFLSTAIEHNSFEITDFLIKNKAKNQYYKCK